MIMTMTMIMNTRARSHRADEPAARLHPAGPRHRPQERPRHQGDLPHVTAAIINNNN